MPACPETLADFTRPYNQGIFVKGEFLPQCNRCGLCCAYEFKVYSEEYAEFDRMHGWSEPTGKIIRKYSPCVNLEVENGRYRCGIHEEERPDCCSRFGLGNYHHPPGCVFFGGTVDEKYYRDD